MFDQSVVPTSHNANAVGRPQAQRLKGSDLSYYEYSCSIDRLEVISETQIFGRFSGGSVYSSEGGYISSSTTRWYRAFVVREDRRQDVISIPHEFPLREGNRIDVGIIDGAGQRIVARVFNHDTENYYEITRANAKELYGASIGKAMLIVAPCILLFFYGIFHAAFTASITPMFLLLWSLFCIIVLPILLGYIISGTERSRIAAARKLIKTFPSKRR